MNSFAWKWAGIVVLAVGLMAMLHHDLGAAPPETQGDAKAEKPAPAPRPAAPKTHEYTSAKTGVVLVYVPGGTFTMGSDSEDEDARPAHKITVKGFWLGKFEVTNAQYARFLKGMGADESRHEPSYWGEKGYDDPQQPVVGVTWRNAMAYCKWAGARLPTEAEWEYAAAAGAKQLKYPTATGEIGHDLANFQGKQGKDEWEGPAPVGQFPPSPLGLYDMAGNAWEWTSSTFRPYPFTTENQPSEDTRVLRVMRGGCWQFGSEASRTIHRHRFADHLTLDFAGFRIAMDPAERKTEADKSSEEKTEGAGAGRKKAKVIIEQ